MFARTGAYNFDTNDFWKNFLRDLELGQLDKHAAVCVPLCRRPDSAAGIGFISMLGWGNAVTILPEKLYQQFGDEEALPRQYESMKLFVEAEPGKWVKKNFWIGPSLGDWLGNGKRIAWQQCTTIRYRMPLSYMIQRHQRDGRASWEKAMQTDTAGRWKPQQKHISGNS